LAKIKYYKPNKALAKNIKSRLLGMNVKKLKKPLFVFTHHKTSTVLMGNVLRRISDALNLRFCMVYGHCENINNQADVILFEHSLVSPKVLDREFVGVHVIRDPRDVVVSGYKYHKYTNEEWCTSIPPHNLPSIIKYPIIDHVREHKSERWKQQYLQGLKGLSYQQNLNTLSEEEGLIFEMKHYAGWTIKDMLNWNYEDSRILEFKMEDIMTSFEISFRQILESINMSNTQVQYCLKKIAVENINNMSDEQILQNKHIQGRSLSKWESTLVGQAKSYFDENYEMSLKKLGYD
jgi:hypothetical protein